MKTQDWFCDGCRQNGTIVFRSGDDVMRVVHLIRDAHIAVSPQCSADPRVINHRLLVALGVSPSFLLPRR